MSRKLRLEAERALQIKEDEKGEQDKFKIMRERMYAPIEWKVYPNDIKIIDLKELYYSEVLDLITQYFIPEDVLTRNAEMEEDEVSIKSFLDKCLFYMKDTTSLVAVNYRYEPYELVGCCIMRVVNKDDFGRVFSSTIMTEGEAQEKCAKIRNVLLRKVDIYEEFQCEVYLRIYLVCIKPVYRKQGYGYDMMRCAVNSARSLHVPVIMGIFAANTLQRCGKRIGMKVLHEISYVQWKNRETNTLIFDDPGPGNYTIALMAGKVPSQALSVEPPVIRKVEVVVEKGPVLTRKERREIAAKKKKHQSIVNNPQ